MKSSYRVSLSGVLSDIRPWEANLIDKQLCDKSGRGSTTHKTVDQCAKTVNDVIFICSLFLAIFCGILVDNEWYFGEKGSSTSAPKEEVPPTLEPRDSGLKFWMIQQTFWALLSLSKLWLCHLDWNLYQSRFVYHLKRKLLLQKLVK